MYVPKLARFLSRDRLGVGGIDLLDSPPVLDPYRYVRNNPSRHTDPSGLGPCIAITLGAPWWSLIAGYGNFCGAGRVASCTGVDKPAPPPINKPIDALDAACMRHWPAPHSLIQML